MIFGFFNLKIRVFISKKLRILKPLSVKKFHDRGDENEKNWKKWPFAEVGGVEPQSEKQKQPLSVPIRRINPADRDAFFHK